MAVKKAPVRKNKRRRVVSVGHVYILASNNNTLVSVTDTDGNTLFQRSSGQMGFKGTKKSTPYAATMVSSAAAEEAALYSMSDVHVFLKDVGMARENAIRALHNGKLNILSIHDVTPRPHAGCRKRRLRRV